MSKQYRESTSIPFQTDMQIIFHVFIIFQVLLPASMSQKSHISRIHARQIFDSRGNPTVEVDLVTDKGYSKIIYLFYSESNMRRKKK